MDTQRSPLVSVIIPTYNAAEFLAEAIQSALNQTYRNCEIIVVDDGSTDGTEMLLQAFGQQVKYVRQGNRGPSAARNTGIRLAQGEYLCFLDADDVWRATKVEAQVSFMEAYRDIGMVFCDEEEVDGEKVINGSLLRKSQFYPEIVAQSPISGAYQKLLIENFIPTSMVMLKRECLGKAGLFDEALRVSEDRDLWSRVAAHYRIAGLPTILGQKRAHPNNISSKVELTLRSRIRVWHKARRLFPALAPAAIVDGLLAQGHLELGYLLLTMGQCKEAPKSALQSLWYAVRRLVAGGSMSHSLPSYRWRMAIALVPLTMMGWLLTQSLSRSSNSLFKKR